MTLSSWLGDELCRYYKYGKYYISISGSRSNRSSNVPALALCLGQSVSLNGQKFQLTFFMSRDKFSPNQYWKQ